MAISRDTKQNQVSVLRSLLSDSKLTAFAQYDGLSVADVQELRRAARQNGVAIKVVKNRLMRVAMQDVPALKGSDTSLLKGQLLYAISTEDEVAPAQTLAAFAKKHDALRLAGGFSLEGNALNEAEIKALAALPTKDQLRGQLAGTIAGPLSGLASVLSGNLKGMLYALNARIKQLENA